MVLAQSVLSRVERPGGTAGAAAAEHTERFGGHQHAASPEPAHRYGSSAARGAALQSASCFPPPCIAVDPSVPRPRTSCVPIFDNEGAGNTGVGLRLGAHEVGKGCAGDGGSAASAAAAVVPPCSLSDGASYPAAGSMPLGDALPSPAPALAAHNTAPTACAAPRAARPHLRLRVVVQNVCSPDAAVIVAAHDASLVMRDGTRVPAAAVATDESSSSLRMAAGAVLDDERPREPRVEERHAAACPYEGHCCCGNGCTSQPVVLAVGGVDPPPLPPGTQAAPAAVGVALAPLACAVLQLAFDLSDLNAGSSSSSGGGARLNRHGIAFEPEALEAAAYLSLPVRAAAPPHAVQYALCLAIEEGRVWAGYRAAGAAGWAAVDDA